MAFWAAPLLGRPGGPLDVVVRPKAAQESKCYPAQRAGRIVHISNNLLYLTNIPGDTATLDG